MWAIPTGASWLLKKKKKKSPSLESRVTETGSDPPIGSGRDSGRDIDNVDDILRYINNISPKKSSKKQHHVSA